VCSSLIKMPSKRTRLKNLTLASESTMIISLPDLENSKD
jgi:hypothetical protein